MAYGLATRMFLDNGKDTAANSAPNRSSATAHALVWSKLKREERFRLVSGALRQAA